MIVFYVLLWYFSSISFNIVYKEASKSQDYTTLNALQLIVGSFVFTAATCFETQHKITIDRYSIIVAFTFLIGNQLTNMCMHVLPITVAQTIKSSEPMFGLVLNMIINGKKYNRESIYSVLSLGCGLLVMCYQKDNLQTMGLIYGISANVCLQLRNIIFKRNSDQSYTPICDFLSCFPMFLPFSIVGVGISRNLFTSLFGVSSAILFVLYQTFSIKVLTSVDDVVTHAILNIVKRILIILCAVVIEFNTITYPTLINAFIILMGSISYSMSQINYKYRGTFATGSLGMSILLNGILISASTYDAKKIEQQEEMIYPTQIMTTDDVHLFHNTNLKPIVSWVTMNDSIAALHYSNEDLLNHEEEMSSGNFGNWVWMRGTLSLIDPSKHIVINHRIAASLNLSHSVPYLHSDANIFGSMESFGHHYCRESCIHTRKSLFRKYSRIAAIGFGTQLNYDRKNVTSFQIQIHPLLIDMMKVIEAKMPYYYTRGDVTTNVLKYNTLKKAVSNGCPSLMLHPSNCLGRTLENKYNEVIRKIKNKIPLKIALAPLGPHVGKNKISSFIINMLKTNPDNAVFMQNKDDMNKLAEFGLPQKYLSQSFHFHNTSKWKETLSSFDVMISARIHGAMMAIFAEVPAFLVSTDYRIKELADYMHIPYLEMQSFSGDINDFTNLSFDGNSFDEVRRSASAKFESMFKYVGIHFNPVVKSLQRACVTIN